MDQSCFFRKYAAFLTGIATLAPVAGAVAQENTRPCPPPPQSSVLVLSARPSSIALNQPTTVSFRLLAVGRGTVQDVRLTHGQTVVPMASLGSASRGLFSGQAVITATSPEAIDAVAEVRQRLGSGAQAVSCLARSNTLRLAVTAVPPPQPVLETVSAKGVSLRHPANWQVNRAVVADDGPLALNNFHSRYLPGGVAPEGGAEIDITFTPRPQASAQEALARDLPDVKFVTSEQVVVDGSAGIQAWYHDDFGPGLMTTNAAVYVPRGRHLYKFFLTFHAGDPQEKTYAVQFRQILHLVQFKEPP